MMPTFFATPAEFRKWLQKNHAKEKELLVGFYKVNSGKPSISWSQSVDEALCFGWIDGVRKSWDDISYTIRFTPRKATSNWSAVNIAKMEVLTAKGLMQPAGLASFDKRQESKSKIYAYENEAKEFDAAYLKKFKANKKAWNFFKFQAPSYIKVSIHRVMSAKQEQTKSSRLEKLMKASEEGRRIL